MKPPRCYSSLLGCYSSLLGCYTSCLLVLVKVLVNKKVVRTTSASDQGKHI